MDAGETPAGHLAPPFLGEKASTGLQYDGARMPLDPGVALIVPSDCVVARRTSPSRCTLLSPDELFATSAYAIPAGGSSGEAVEFAVFVANDRVN